MDQAMKDLIDELADLEREFLIHADNEDDPMYTAAEKVRNLAARMSDTLSSPGAGEPSTPTLDIGRFEWLADRVKEQHAIFERDSRADHNASDDPSGHDSLTCTHRYHCGCHLYAFVTLALAHLRAINAADRPTDHPSCDCAPRLYPSPPSLPEAGARPEPPTELVTIQTIPPTVGYPEGVWVVIQRDENGEFSEKIAKFYSESRAKAYVSAPSTEAGTIKKA